MKFHRHIAKWSSANNNTVNVVHTTHSHGNSKVNKRSILIAASSLTRWVMIIVTYCISHFVFYIFFKRFLNKFFGVHTKCFEGIHISLNKILDEISINRWLGSGMIHSSQAELIADFVDNFYGTENFITRWRCCNYYYSSILSYCGYSTVLCTRYRTSSFTRTMASYFLNIFRILDISIL